MPRDEEDAQMRAQLALMELEQIGVNEKGEITDKPYEANRMRLAGKSWKQVAQKLGYPSEQGAWQAWKIYMQQAAVRLSDQRKEEALNLNLGRLEALMHQHWSAALLGDVQSAGVVLKCITEMNKILGLYESTESKTTERFVVITREAETYADQLKKIALEPKQLEANHTQKSGAQDATG